MQQVNALRELALRYHQHLPSRVWEYLSNRGIADSIIHSHLLGWNGRRITIPIFNRQRQLAFFKFAKDPEDRSDTPKMLASTGATAELYGWERVLAQAEQIIICEGEFDRLVLESRGFAAVTSTAGALTFKREWAEAVRQIPKVFVCFDNDDAGRHGSEQVARLIPEARIVYLPEDVGDGGDLTDFLVHQGRSSDEFLTLLETAAHLPYTEAKTSVRKIRLRPVSGREIDELKSRVRIERVISRYLHLRHSGQNYLGRCPFHEDHYPSFVVYRTSQRFHCYGCNAHGDSITFLMQVAGISFSKAFELLRSLIY